MTREEKMQIVVMDYIRLKYPKTLAIHVPNGGKRNPIEGYKFKRMGVMPGVPDILIFHATEMFNGLAIELKVHPNKPSLAQKKIINKFINEKWLTIICYSFDEAMAVIDEYLKFKKR